MSVASLRFSNTMPKIGFWSGPVLAVILWAAPLHLPPDAQKLVGLLAWVTTWWFFEVMPLAVTAMMGLFLAIILGIVDAQKALEPFAQPRLLFFFAGFLLARAMQAHRLDQRIALYVLSRPLVAGRPFRSVIALVVIGAVTSFFVSNFAAMAMISPIALGVLSSLFREDKNAQGVCLLAIAYATTIGGMGTPVGTPANLVTLDFLEKAAGNPMTFGRWVSFALPIVVVSLLSLVFITRRVLPKRLPKQDPGFFVWTYDNLGPMTMGQRNCLMVLSSALVLWFGPAVLDLFLPESSRVMLFFRERATEPVVFGLAACMLFLLPCEGGRKTLTWEDASKVDWSVLLLFGAGLSLGNLIIDTGLAKSIGDVFVGRVGTHVPYIVSLTFIVIFTIFLGEFTTTTASLNLLVPIIVTFSQITGQSVTNNILAVGLTCAIGFMMPISTAPNAIAFGSGLIPMPRMMRFGLVINVVCCFWIILFFELLHYFKITL